MADRPAGTDLGRRVWALFTPYRRSLVVIVVAVLLSSGLGIITPFLTQAAFDRRCSPPTASSGPRLLVWLVVGMVAVPVVSALIGVYQTWQTTLLGNRVMADLRGRLFEHLQRMDLAFFTATRTGAIQSRLANDVGRRPVGAVGDGELDPGQHRDGRRRAGGDAAAVVAAHASSRSRWCRCSCCCRCGSGGCGAALAGRTQESLSDMTAITEESLSVSGVLLAKVFNRQADEVRRYTRGERPPGRPAGAPGDDRAVVLRGRADVPRA